MLILPACWIHQVVDIHKCKSIVNYVIPLAELRLLRQAKHDLDSLKIWKRKCSDSESNASTIIRDWQLKQHNMMKDGCEVMLAKFIKFVVMSESDESVGNDVIKSVLEWRSEIATSLASRSDRCAMIASFNQCAPQTLTAAQSKVAWNLFSWVLAQSVMNIGILQCPTFTHHRNKLILIEQDFIMKLSKMIFISDVHQGCDSDCFGPMHSFTKQFAFIHVSNVIHTELHRLIAFSLCSLCRLYTVIYTFHMKSCRHVGMVVFW